jgi:DNA-binding YbaB/EbfC family protein
MFNFGNLGDMMKQLKDMQENIENVKSKMKEEKYTASVGGDLVKVTVNGLGEIIDIEIDDSLFTEENKDLLKELIISGVNEATKKAKENLGSKLSEAVGLPMNIPGLSSLFD